MIYRALYAVPSKYNHFLPDANIWLRVYCPHEKTDSNKNEYQKLLKLILEGANKKVFISFQILSEIYNRWLRNHYDKLCEDKKLEMGNFKREYVKSKYYAPEVGTINAIFKQILADDRIEVNTSDLTIDKKSLISILDKTVYLDFNDSLLAHLCKKKNLVLITADNDFKIFQNEITILSYDL
jgi:predicted nucleic acid-binding protein